MFKNLNAKALGVSGHESEIIELALTYGFRGMDIDIVEYATRVRLKGMAYARRLIDSARIRLGTFPLPMELETDEEAFQRDLEKLAQYAPVAAEMGCIRCVTTVSPSSSDRPYHENFEFHRRRLAEVCKVLAGAGVHLGVGFRGAEELRKNKAFQFVYDFEALSLLIKMTGAPNVGLLLDVWDLYVSGGSIENLRSLSGRQIIAVQLANAPAEAPLAGMSEQCRLLPGQDGQIDLAAVLSLLSERGYDGPVTPVPSRATLDSTRRDAAVRAAGEGMARLWAAAGLPPEGKYVCAAK